MHSNSSRIFLRSVDVFTLLIILFTISIVHIFCLFKRSVAFKKNIILMMVDIIDKKYNYIPQKYEFNFHCSYEDLLIDDFTSSL